MPAYSCSRCLICFCANQPAAVLYTQTPPPLGPRVTQVNFPKIFQQTGFFFLSLPPPPPPSSASLPFFSYNIARPYQSDLIFSVISFLFLSIFGQQAIWIVALFGILTGPSSCSFWIVRSPIQPLCKSSFDFPFLLFSFPLWRLASVAVGKKKSSRLQYVPLKKFQEGLKGDFCVVRNFLHFVTSLFFPSLALMFSMQIIPSGKNAGYRFFSPFSFRLADLMVNGFSLDIVSFSPSLFLLTKPIEILGLQ